MPTDTKPRTVQSFAKDIIDGPGGMNEFERREHIVWHTSERVAAATWAIRCLANPDCAGSEEVLKQILARRERLRKETGTCE